MKVETVNRQRKVPVTLKTRERILDAATALFAEKGFDGTSTKEICDRAGVNIAAIHYHFTSKERLYSEIIEGFGDITLKSMQRILHPPTTTEELRIRLELFLNDAIDSMLSMPELCRIVQAEMELLHERSEPVFRKTFLKRFETLVSFLSIAKKRRLLAMRVDPRLAARSLFSQLCHQTRTDAVYQKYYGQSLTQPRYRSLWVQQTLTIFLEGIHASHTH